MDRIVIVGTSGAGKTTLAKNLSFLFGHKMTDLDDLFWLSNWIARDKEETNALIMRVIEQKRWILSGNYFSVMKDHYCLHADTIIWLDYPLWILLWRVFIRSLKRIQRKEKCCNGNYESITRFLSSNSILWWVCRTYLRRKRAYKALFNELKESSIKLIRLRTSKEVKAFLKDATLINRST